MADEAIQMAPAGTRGDASSLPADVLPLVPVRNVVLFPGTVLPVTMSRPRSIAAAQAAVRAERPIGVVLQREQEAEDPNPLDLHRIGTVAAILRYVTAPDGNHHLICQGQQRFRILEYVGGHPFLAARVERFDEPEEHRPEVDARFMLLRERALEAVELLPQAPRELADTIRGIGSATLLADLVASTMDISPAEKQEVLETLDIHRRLDRVLEFLEYRLSVLRLTREIGQATRTNLEKRQREVLLREQLQTIRRELGEEEGGAAEAEDLRKAVEEAGMPEEVEGAGAEGGPPARAHARGRGRARHDPLLSRRADRAALVEGDRRTGSTWPRRAASSTRTTTTSTRSSAASSSTWRSASWRRRAGARSCASSARPASARPASARASPAPWAASSPASRWAACTTRARSAATGAPMSAPCPATSSRRSARPAPAIPC